MPTNPIGAEYLAGFFDGEGCVMLHGKYAETRDAVRSQQVMDGLARARAAGRHIGATRRELDLDSVSHLSHRAAAKVLGVAPYTVYRRRMDAIGRPSLRRPQARVNHFCLRLIIANTHLPTLEAIQQRFGGRLRELRVSGNRRRTFQLHWTGRTAEPLIEAIYPFAVTKREQLEIARAFLALRNRGRKANYECRSANGYGAGYTKSPEVIAEENAMKSKLRLLNKRGIA